MKKFKLFSLASLTGIWIATSTLNTYAAGWIWDSGYWWYQNEDGSYACNGSQVIDGILCSFDSNGHWIEDNTQTGQLSEQEKKILHIHEICNNINARNDWQVCRSSDYIDYGEQGNLVKAELISDYYLSFPKVEYYYENSTVIFAYATDGQNEYRYYYENSKLIREIGPDGVAIDYPDGDGLEKSYSPNATEILSRGNWEAVLYAEDFYGTE